MGESEDKSNLKHDLKKSNPWASSQSFKRGYYALALVLCSEVPEVNGIGTVFPPRSGGCFEELSVWWGRQC